MAQGECGEIDLNTPRKEHADGTIWTFARDRYGRLRLDRGELWDHVELALLRGFQPRLPNAFRLLQVGNGTGGNAQNTPAQVHSITNAAQIRRRLMHTCAVLSTWHIECWGTGN
jgi:hypothetical protein